MSAPLDRLRHHVTGAIERGEAAAIEGRPAGPAPRGALVTAAQDMRRYRRPPSYHKGRGCGFLTREPSKRARILAARIIRMRGLFSQWSLN